MPRRAARSIGRPSESLALISRYAVADVQLADREDVQRDHPDVERLVAAAAGHLGDDHVGLHEGPPRRLVAAGVAAEGQLQDVAPGGHVLDPERPVGPEGDGVLVLALEVIFPLRRPDQGIPPGRPLLVGQAGRIGRDRHRQGFAVQAGGAVEEVVHRGALGQGEPADDRPARAAELDPGRLPGRDVDIDPVRRRVTRIVVADRAIDHQPARGHPLEDEAALAVGLDIGVDEAREPAVAQHRPDSLSRRRAPSRTAGRPRSGPRAPG